jgi:hypothetical protein
MQRKFLRYRLQYDILLSIFLELSGLIFTMRIYNCLDLHYIILCYFIPSHTILCIFVSYCFISSHLILSHLILSHLIILTISNYIILQNNHNSSPPNPPYAPNSRSPKGLEDITWHSARKNADPRSIDLPAGNIFLFLQNFLF